MTEIIDTTFNIEESIINEENNYLLRELLTTLPSLQFKIVHMRFYRNMNVLAIQEETNYSFNEICNILENSYDNIKKLIKDKNLCTI